VTPVATVQRLGVIDSGETAVRVLNAVGGLNDAGDVPPITTVLFHDEPDPQPWYGREADEIKPLCENVEQRSIDDVVACLRAADVDTLWLGSWPGEERAGLIGACAAAGIGVVGPNADTVRRLSDPAQLPAIGDRAALLDGRPLRRVEVDILADDHGTVWNLGGRDVSVRRSHHSLVAEAPCAAVSDELATAICGAASDLARDVGYRGAGMVTFVHDHTDFAITAVDCIAPPDHATSEERSGASFIGWRLRVHRGEALPEQEPAADGVAMEVRLLAEDPDDGFAVGSGRVALVSFPVGTGVRVDANRRVGDRVDETDSLLAIITAWGPDRSVALTRIRRALERTAVVIEDGTTNLSFLLALLDNEQFQRDEVDHRWLDRMIAERPPPEPDPIVLLAAAVEAYEADRRRAQEAFYASAERGRPRQPDEVGAGIELGYLGESYRLDVGCVAPRTYSVRFGRTVADVTVDRLDDYERRLTCAGRRHRIIVSPTEFGFRLQVGHASHVIQREDGVLVRAGWPALIVSTLVQPGDVVVEGQPIAVLESMKMETTVEAPFAGVVLDLLVTANSQVERGAALLRLRPQVSKVVLPGGRRLDLSGFERTIDFSRKPCDRVYEPLGDYLLGYDLAPAELRRLLTEQRRLAEIADAADASLVACEDGLLDIFAELGSLYRPQTEVEHDDLAPSGENTQEYLVSFLQWLDADRAGLPDEYRARLERALDRFGVRGLGHTPELEAALMWLFRSFSRLSELSPVVLAILERRLAHRDALQSSADAEMRARLDRLATATQGRQQPVADLARDVRFHYFDEPPIEAAAAEMYSEMADHLAHLAAHPDTADREERIARLVWCPHPMRSMLLASWMAHDADAASTLRRLLLEIHLRRYYRTREIGVITSEQYDRFLVAAVDYGHDHESVHVVAGYLPLDDLPEWSTAIADHLAPVRPDAIIVVDLVTWSDAERHDIAATAAEVGGLLAACSFRRRIHRVNVTVSTSHAPDAERRRAHSVSFVGDERSFTEELLYRDLHPMLAERLEIWRLSNFALERRPSPEDVYLFDGVAHDNPRDHRLFALAEIRGLTPVRDPETGATTYPRLERVGLLAMAAMRSELTRYTPRDRPVANRLVLDVQTPWTLPLQESNALAQRFAPLAARVGLEKVVLKVRIPDDSQPEGLRHAVLHIEDVGHGLIVREERAGDEPVRPLGDYQQKVLTAARFGSPYPYEIVRLFTQHPPADGLPSDSFVELDLDANDRLVPVHREPGGNSAHIVVGLLTNHSSVVPEGMRRVALLSDPTQGLGNLAEPECRRVNAALSYALEHRLPVEWFAVSSGALIAMDSGTENMDWIALTLRRLIEFTQAGGEVNIVVTGINVGGQPYWNAEATMLTHTKGILVMTPSSTMVLTGKQALDFSGAVSAEDNFGIGGYHRVMGPNGQAQYWAPSFAEACSLLLRHYELTYVVPGERFPRRRPTADPIDRDVRASGHAALANCPFSTVGDVFSAEFNPERKQPFDMRSIMRAVADTDSAPLERWKDLRDGDTSIVWDTTVGGIPVSLLGIESHTVGRQGYVPSDGPPAWTSGTLFPHSSRKAARAINAANGNRPLVVLANLSGFDGSPESMRRRQLEFGAEIGRAVTNFDGPIVFVVVSRYHGGAFVVFSKALNEEMEIAAVEGSYASVIGGAPAAATVFAREVKQRTERDPRVREAREAAASASGTDAARRRTELAKITEQVRSEKLGEVADEFDGIHTIERALRVGSVDRIIAAADLRPYVVDALERGMARHGVTP
jgi:acetyl/propionyl-CoA carboxylase alpha subunit/acetyl-CoA carboxylase carboxyltransferase component